MDIPPSPAAIHSRACCIRTSGSPTWCGMSATFKGVRGAERASSTAAGNGPSDGRSTIGSISMLRATAATHRLSNVDSRSSVLGTRGRVLMVDMWAHTPQSLSLPSGCFASAARAVASKFSATGHTVLWPLGAMRTILTATSKVWGH